MARSVKRLTIDVGGRLAPDTSPRRSARALADDPNVSQAHRDVARRLSSPVLMGPPLCDELVALVEHLYSEEEARVVRHLPPVRGLSARAVALL